ncbi:uncharacterized protein PHALS_10265 [Plasmopara halstedii]|uniref:Uncharacterized protein n=1 Tax=Plasmopara halstedii TaxID=4781 RepID=A0A0N7L4Z4_PLAHL|nr:uncharacterized protein PHALS_10265 [Plasmopara halstedii]CEG40043.1 hypothetical protein PHALS_10265 [Plasmopara halstedii]|eukprot:XP_024576412.1 hypothetical protein PHALS_10265 [Plasmopara halstedii]
MVLMVEAVLNFHWIDIHTWRNSQEHSTDETMPKCGLNAPANNLGNMKILP